ncbi:MAG: response regulator [Alphaproteobacteria bacterium]
MARILLAEDDRAVQSFVSRALAHRGHAVTAVDDGLQALEALGAAGSEAGSEAGFDLLITDIVMPGLDGIALALKVARDCPKLPILMMTGYSAERQRAHNLEELICRVITKPFSLEQICKAAEEVLAAGSATRSPETAGAAPGHGAFS